MFAKGRPGEVQVLPPSCPTRPRQVSGMILGNSVTACALAAAKVTDALATERQTLERLGERRMGCVGMGWDGVRSCNRR